LKSEWSDWLRKWTLFVPSDLLHNSKFESRIWCNKMSMPCLKHFWACLIIRLWRTPWRNRYKVSGFYVQRAMGTKISIQNISLITRVHPSTPRDVPSKEF
jgi:hypothetical protein